MSSETLFSRILALNAEAVASGNFETAYHLLAAALHAAKSSGDLNGIERVSALAEQQGADVDAIYPDHAIASASATRRGTTPLFRSLVGTADAMRAQLHADHAHLHHQRATEESS